MSDLEAINKAIGAHGLWKQRLRTAIETGHFDQPLEQVQSDGHCDFGKWLKSLGPEEAQQARGYGIQELHAAFHQEAGRVLALTLQGQRILAEAAMEEGGAFTSTSTQLTMAMMSWRRSLEA